MKTISKSLFLGTCFFFLLQGAFAGTGPVITKKYSNEEIDKLIQAYHLMESKDIIPQTILKQKFNQDFPKASDVEWEISGNIYYVDFEISFTDYSAYYDKDGNLLMYSFEISKSKIPVSVKNVIQGKYPKYRLDDAKKMFKGTEIFYKIDLEKGEMDVELVLKEDGTIINELVD